MSVEPAPRTGAALMKGAGAVALAISLMNVMTYGFTALIARQVAPPEFGVVTALMGILLVGSVAALGLQATTARRLATCPRNERNAVVIGARRATYVIGVSASALLLLASPLLVRILDTDGLLPLVLVALTLVPLVVSGAQAGVAQGEGRWGALAALYIAVGSGRLVGGTLGALVWPSASGAISGVLVGALVPVVVGWRLLRTGDAMDSTLTGGGLVAEALQGSHALLAFFAVTNADAVLARVVLSEHDSGLYAAGLIIAKAALFLPQFVAVVAFPAMARDRDDATRRVATLIVGALGAAAALGCWLLPQLALVFAGGERYTQVQGLLPLFAVEGAVFALVNLLVYDALAAESRGVIVLLWVILSAVVAVSLLVVDTITGLVVTMVVAGLCAGVGRLLPRSN